MFNYEGVCPPPSATACLSLHDQYYEVVHAIAASVRLSLEAQTSSSPQANQKPPSAGQVVSHRLVNDRQRPSASVSDRERAFAPRPAADAWERVLFVSGRRGTVQGFCVFVSGGLRLIFGGLSVLDAPVY